MQDSCDGIDRVEKERGGQHSRNCVRSRNQCRLTVIQEVHKTFKEKYKKELFAAKFKFCSHLNLLDK